MSYESTISTLKGNPLAEASFGSQVFSFGIVQAVVRLRGLITLPILTRLIGAEGYGMLAPLLAFSGIVQTFLLLGTPTALTVFIPGNPPEKRRRDFWGIVQLTFLSSALCVSLMIALRPFIAHTFFLPGTTTGLYVAAMAIIPINALQMVFYAQIINNREGKAYSKIILASSCADLLLLVSGSYWFGLIGLLLATLLSQAFLCFLMATAIRRKDEIVWLRFSQLPSLKRYYTYGMTLFLSGMGAWIVDSSDRFIIGKYLGAHDLGVYQVTYSLCYQLNYLAAPLFATLMPFVVEAVKKGDREAATGYLEQSYRALVFFFVPAVLILSVNGRDLLALLTGDEFRAGSALVPFIAIGISLWQVVGVYSYLIHAHQRGQLLMVSLGCGALTNVGMNLLLVPRYGLMAAAFSTFVAYLVIFVMDGYFAGSLLKVGLRQQFLLKLGTAALGLFLSMLVIQTVTAKAVVPVRFIVSSLTGGGVYLFLAYGMNLFTREERDNLVRAARRVLVGNGKGI